MSRRQVVTSGGAAIADGPAGQVVVLDLVVPVLTISHGSVSDLALTLSAEPIYVTKSRHQLAHWLRTFAITPTRTDEILLAVSEAVTNAIEHGSGGDASKRVSIRATFDGQSVTATVVDSGRWINAALRPDYSRYRGRGLILMNELTASLDIVCTAKGTHITMRFDVSDLGDDQVCKH